MTNNSLTEIEAQLKKSQNVVIFCHARPDGDALGAGLSLLTALENAGKRVCMCCDDLPPEKFDFLNAVKKVSNNIIKNFKYDTLISVDCADVTRMGSFARIFSQFKGITINIDHHVSNGCFAKFNYVVECPATCELICEILLGCGFEITEEIANLLMLGLITDSGNFTHLDVTEKTFRTAAILRARGADVSLINYNMYSRQSKSRAILYGRVMNGIRFALDDKLAFIIISDKNLKECGADKSVTEGFVDFPLTIDGVEVSVSVLESDKKQYKISLRSKGAVNVNAVATEFGGGGHVLASGCMIFGELEEVIEKVTYAVYRNL